MNEAKQRVTHMITEIDQAELTVRLLEIGIKLKRPPGMPARTLLADTRQAIRDGKLPDILNDFEAMAAAAIEYFGERIRALERVQ